MRERKAVIGGRGKERGKGEHDQVLEGIQERSSEGQHTPETWEVRDSQDLKGGTLDEMPYRVERELIESTFSRRQGIKWRDGVAIPQSKTLTQNCSCLKELQRQKWKKA